MPSLQDFFNQLTEANATLQQIHADVQAQTNATNAVKASVDQVNTTLSNGFANLAQGNQVLANLQHETNKLVRQKIKQEETIICILEKISRNTCEQLTEASSQTRHQAAIREAGTELQSLYQTAHADAALEFERLQRIRADLLACCPPEEPPPACVYEPCPKPPRL